MKSVGLITEYNPFHNGHLYHLQESLRVTGSDVSIAVMSGHFLQRGEPALADKWVRTEMALAAGVDLVVELPLPWASSSAPDFALGGVQALTALGVNSVCFGSEVGELEALQTCSDLLCREETLVTDKTAELLREGMNYPQARQQVLGELLPKNRDTEMLTSPNNILGIEYLNAIKRAKSPLIPATIKRVGAGYHDVEPGENGISSATAIRKWLAAEKAVDTFLPPAVSSLLKEAAQTDHLYSEERYYPLLVAQLVRNSEELTQYHLVDSGIENRLVAVADKASSLDDLITGLKSRQLTRTRIQRLLVAILLGLDKVSVARLFSAGPLYLHLLGASPKGRHFLSFSRKGRQLPLVQNFSRIYAVLKHHYGANSSNYSQALQQLELELRATKIYTLLMRKYCGESRNRDFYEDLRR